MMESSICRDGRLKMCAYKSRITTCRERSRMCRERSWNGSAGICVSVNELGKPGGVVLVFRNNGLAVAGGVAVNVLNGLLEAVHHPHRQNVIQKLRAEGENTLVCACNGRFYGGGFNPSTTARPDDGIHMLKQTSGGAFTENPNTFFSFQVQN